MPRASIIVPAYNAADYIKETLDSILAQTFDDFECLVIDDGSTDDTADAVKSFQDSRIKLFQQKNSGGPAKPRNVGLTKSVGEYIFMFDSDDLMLPEKVARSVEALDQYPEADLLFTNFQAVDEKSSVIKEDFLEEYETLWSLMKDRSSRLSLFEPKKIFDALIRKNFIGTSSVVLRRSALRATDRFNETLRNSDDRLFWLRFAKHHKFLFLNEVHHQYRIQQKSISNQGFERRGPSKIKALELARDLCETPLQKRLINQQIAADFISLSYSYWKRGTIWKAGWCLMKSLKFGINPPHKTLMRGIKDKLLPTNAGGGG